MFRNKLFKSFVCFMLCLSFLAPNISVAASIHREENDFAWLENFADNLDFSAVFYSLSLEAQILMREHMQSPNSQLLSFYNSYVNFGSPLETRQDISQNYFIASLLTPLQILEAQLLLIGLSTAVVFAFVAAGATLVTSAGTMPVVPVSLILAAVSLGTIGIVAILNWTDIARNWTHIINAFVYAFSTSFQNAAPAMNEAFTTVRTELDVMEQRVGIALRAITQATHFNLTDSASRHIESDFILWNLRNTWPIAMYASSVNTTVMFVYELREWMRVNLHGDFLHHPAGAPWQLPDFALNPGTRIYVLYNYRTGRVFHAHLRLFHDDTFQMRLHNRLDWQIFPFILETPFFRTGPNIPALLDGSIFGPHIEWPPTP